jgi:hypothetical protein
MEDDPRSRSALLSALTTEHFVLQSANSTTYTEASARGALYVMALSSSLVALGFMAASPQALLAFALTVLPAVFLLGVFTAVRLVETALESMHLLAGIARIRAYYRTLGPEAEVQFAAHHGRWPEILSPAEQHGRLLAFMGTTASMVAVINNVVAGAALAIALRVLVPSSPTWVCAALGIFSALLLSALFFAYQRWRFGEVKIAAPPPAHRGRQASGRDR